MYNLQGTMYKGYSKVQWFIFIIKKTLQRYKINVKYTNIYKLFYKIFLQFVDIHNKDL